MLRVGMFDHLEARPGAPLHQLYAERLDLLERVDKAGFWCFFKSEHHLTPLDMAPSPAVYLSAVAQRTSQIRFGPLVCLLPFHHPLRLLEEVAMLDHLSGGRLELGVGRGIAPPEHELWGLENENARARSEETLAILLAGFETDTLTYHGQFWDFDGVPVEMRPLQQPHPPLWYPGNIDTAAARGFNTVVGGPPAAVAQSVARYREVYAASGETPVNPQQAEPIIAATTRICLAPTDREAQDRARSSWKAYTHNITKLWHQFGLYELPRDPTVGGDFDRAMENSVCVAGSPSRMRDWVDELVETSGVEHLIISMTWGDLDQNDALRTLDLFCEHVMPQAAPA